MSYPGLIDRGFTVLVNVLEVNKIMPYVEVIYICPSVM
jgi:hypothetical protein